MSWRLAAIIACGLLAATDVAVAHHSFAMFDQAKQLSLMGTVREFQWTNPRRAGGPINVPKAQ